MSAAPDLVALRAGAGPLLSAAAWRAFEDYSAGAVTALLGQVCKDGDWNNLANAAAAGCMHGQGIRDRLGLVAEAMPRSQQAFEAGLAWIGGLVRGESVGSAAPAPVSFLPSLLSSTLRQHVIDASGPYALATARALLAAGARSDARALTLAVDAGRPELLALLLGETRYSADEPPPSAHFRGWGERDLFLYAVAQYGVNEDDADRARCVAEIASRYAPDEREHYHALFEKCQADLRHHQADALNLATAGLAFGATPRGDASEVAATWQQMLDWPVTWFGDEVTGDRAETLRLPFALVVMPMSAAMLQVAMSRLIVEGNLDLGLRTCADGETMLHVATRHGSRGGVEALLALGADPSAEARLDDGSWVTPATLAERGGQPEIAQMIAAARAHNALHRAMTRAAPAPRP